MKVTTSILIALIKEKGLTQDLLVAHESNLEIRGFRLADKTADAHILYVCSDAHDIMPDAENAAFVLVSPSPQTLPASKADLFELITDDKPLTVLYRLYDLLFRLQKWDHDLKETAASAYHFYQLFSVGREIYPYPFCLINHEFKIIGITKDMYPFSPSGERPENNKISDSRSEELLSDPTFQATSALTGIYTYPSHQKNVTRLCINITQNDTYLGRILSDVRDDTPGIRALFKHLADTLSTAFLSYTDDVMISRENDSLHQLLSDLLTGERSYDDAALILERYHWDEKSLYRIAVISLADKPSNQMTATQMIRSYLSHLLERKFALSCVLTEGETIVLICPAQETAEVYQKKLREATFTWSLSIGVSSPVAFKHLKSGYRQARFALQQQTASDETLFFDACRTDYIMAVLKREMPDEDFCHPGLRKLMEKDEKENTNDMGLVWELIRAGFNVSKAAENSYVHRSTFIRRLHIISQITGIDFSHPLSPETLFDVLISFRLLRHAPKEDRLPDFT